jgi:hydroxymethylbilane synthase
MKPNFVIGSRGSALALWQAEFVKGFLESHLPEITFEIKTISTTGDQLTDTALSKIGDKGLFTKQIETELLAGSIDFAVHSLKDLQTEQPRGLVIGAVCEREQPNDALIGKRHNSIADLPTGATVATGSLRRKSQLLNYRPDLQVIDIRGNVPTRLEKFDKSDIDALILAYAGLHRLGLDKSVSQLIPFKIMLPAVGQGAIAIEIREGDEDSAEVAAVLDHRATRICITAERAFLRRLEGGCQVPIGGYATLDDDRIRLEGMVGSRDGKTVFRERVEGDVGDAEELGIELARSLEEKGAVELLAEGRAEGVASPKTV